MMEALKHRALCAFLALAWSGVAIAQDNEEGDLALAYGDKAMVSIATGGQQPITRAPAVASVITSRDIAAMGATDLDQVLESVPGLHVSMSSMFANSLYSFRGVNTKFNPQVLMLVNGIPIIEAYTGSRGLRWSGMPLENVARIEVIRGPGSALYGADAFSGVINVITKTAADINGTEYGLRVGSFNSRDAWIQHGGKLGALDAAFYFRVDDTDGQKGIIQQDAQSALDTCFSTGSCPPLPLIPGYTPVSRAPGPIDAERKTLDARADLSYEAWRFRAAYQQGELGMGTGLAGSLDHNARSPVSRFSLDMNYAQTNWAQNWDVSGVIGYYDIKNNIAEPNTVLFPAGAMGGAFPNGMIGNPGYSEQHTHASASAFYTGFKQHKVRIGAGLREDDIYKTSEIKNFDATLAPLPGGLTVATGNPALIAMLPHKRDVAFLFAQDEWNFVKDWTLTAGIRQDHYSDFGDTTNPRLALVWDAAYNVVVKAMHGEAFRAPSFQELYAINNPVVFGNAKLKPETMKTDELAFAWQPVDKLQTTLNFFHYRMSNIIRPNPRQYQNTGDQTGRGMELEATLDATNNLRLTGNYSLQHSVDAATGKDAGMAPHKRLFARADWRFMPQWQFGTTINHVAERMREPGDTRAQIPDYTTVDMTLRREKFAGNWDARAMVTNLFNADAREPTFQSTGIPSDLPLPRRAFYVQIQHKI
ncbi:MAG: TonB-dependent receptor [Gallionellaceae bacterium]|nr:TonB-dependent receptor [Gallionellaceae bacterium]